MITRHLFLFALLSSLLACQDNSETKEVVLQTEKTIITPAPEVAAEASSLSADHPGADLHMENCGSCHIVDHDEAFYTRADRKTNSYERLQSMVRMCDSQLGTQLFDDDMISIGEFLNDAYYKFPTN